jgi:CubicO group peptidase (beta-lactamase class C family)
MTFEDYIKENILTPLGMYESNFLKEKVSKDLLVSPHVLGDRFDVEVSSIFPYNRMHGPSSTLYSSASEMCRYISCYICARCRYRHRCDVQL